MKSKLMLAIEGVEFLFYKQPVMAVVAFSVTGGLFCPLFTEEE